MAVRVSGGEVATLGRTSRSAPPDWVSDAMVAGTHGDGARAEGAGTRGGESGEVADRGVGVSNSRRTGYWQR